MRDRKTLPWIAAISIGIGGCFSPTVPGESESGTDTNGPSSDTETTETSPTGMPGTDTAETTPTATGPGTSDTSEPTTTSQATGTEETGSDSDTDGPPPGCGDGEVGDGEVCDDGNDVDGDGCNNDCIESGTVLWTASFDDGNDTATSLAIDSNDNVLALALVGNNSNDTFSNWQRLYSPDGDAVQTGSPALDFLSIDIDDAGSIVGSYAAGAQGNGEQGWSFGVGEVEFDGTLVWSSVLPTDRILGRAAARPGGGIAVGGGLRTSPISYNYGHESIVEVFDGSGSVSWSDTPVGAISACSGISVGPKGALAVLCYENYGETIVLQRYSAAGVFQWERELDFSCEYWGNAYSSPDARDLFIPAIGHNEDGRIAAALPTGIVSDLGASVVVYEGTGEEVYSTTISGSGALAVRDLEVLADGSLVLVGSDANPEDANDIDIMVRRLASDGSSLWLDGVPGGLDGGEDRAKEVEVDSLGDIVVFGSTEEGPQDRDLWLRKYAP